MKIISFFDDHQNLIRMMIDLLYQNYTIQSLFFLMNSEESIKCHLPLYFPTHNWSTNEKVSYKLDEMRKFWQNLLKTIHFDVCLETLKNFCFSLYFINFWMRHKKRQIIRKFDVKNVTWISVNLNGLFSIIIIF